MIVDLFTMSLIAGVIGVFIILLQWRSIYLKNRVIVKLTEAQSLIESELQSSQYQLQAAQSHQIELEKTLESYRIQLDGLQEIKGQADQLQKQQIDLNEQLSKKDTDLDNLRERIT